MLLILSWDNYPWTKCHCNFRFIESFKYLNTWSKPSRKICSSFGSLRKREVYAVVQYMLQWFAGVKFVFTRFVCCIKQDTVLLSINRFLIFVILLKDSEYVQTDLLSSCHHSQLWCCTFSSAYLENINTI